VSGGVAQGAARSNVDLLATGYDNTEGQSALAASKDGGVAGRAVGRTDRLGGAVGGGCASSEVELSVASGQACKVDGRRAAGGNDTEVARVRSRSGCWLWGFVGRSGWGRSRALSSGKSTSDETCESESVLHSEECSECVIAGLDEDDGLVRISMRGCEASLYT
jgi:hypothetical protein